MNRKYIIAAAIIVTCLIGLFAVVKGEKKYMAYTALPTLDFSDEMILQMPYFEIVAAAKENRHLPCDVKSYSLGDGYIHLVLPQAVSDKSVVVYYRDEYGNNLARREYDFSDKVMIGDWEIKLDRPTLPTMYFESDNEDTFDLMNASAVKDVVCYGDMQVYVDQDEAKKNGWYTEYLSVDRDEKLPYSASLQGRGNTSWDSNSKKSYNLKFEKKINLLGMGNDDSFNLIGSAYDPSLVKNTVFNKLAADAGIKYQPRMRKVNLYVDGNYEGVYIVTSKVNAGKNRVSLAKGDYLYKMDPATQNQPLYYKSETWFCDGNDMPVADLIYPKDASDKKLSDALDKLQRYIDVIENPNSDDFTDVVDVEMLAKYYWIQEASMNFDAWQRSVYMYYSQVDGKMHLGPVWDMDLTLGSPYDKEGMLFTDPKGWRVRYAGWYTRLFERKEFVETVTDVYFNKGIREILLSGVKEFNDEVESLGKDGNLNYIFYGHSNLGTTLDYGGDTYREYCDNMIAFYSERIKWIDEEMNALK